MGKFAALILLVCLLLGGCRSTAGGSLGSPLAGLGAKDRTLEKQVANDPFPSAETTRLSMK